MTGESTTGGRESQVIAQSLGLTDQDFLVLGSAKRRDPEPEKNSQTHVRQATRRGSKQCVEREFLDDPSREGGEKVELQGGSEGQTIGGRQQGAMERTFVRLMI